MSLAFAFRGGKWPLAPIGSLVELTNGHPFDSDEFGAEGDIPLVRIRDLGADHFETFLWGPVPQRVMLADGDIVIAMDGDFRVETWHRGPAALNQRLCRLRGKPHVDLRYVAYALPLALAEINETQFATTVKHLSSNEIMRSRIPLPPLDEQRRIANYLDDQTTRINKVIELRERQIRGVKQHFNAVLEATIANSAALVPLQLLTDPSRPIQYGIVLPGPDLPEGVPIVKGGDVAAGRLKPDLLARTDPEIESRYPRSRLVTGDILIAIRGSVGEVAVVPAELEGSNITQDAARIAPYGCDGTWLRWTLASQSVQGRILREVTGATISGINIASLRRVLVPFVKPTEQVRRGVQVQSLHDEMTSLVDRLRESVALLAERRKSLITAMTCGT